MKNRLLKILVFLLFVSVSVEITGGLAKTQLSAIFMYAGETHNPQECKTEKGDIEDKTFQQLFGGQSDDNPQSPAAFSYLELKNSVYLSLPHIPPELF